MSIMICPVCGAPFEDEDELDDHILDHEDEEIETEAEEE